MTSKYVAMATWEKLKDTLFLDFGANNLKTTRQKILFLTWIL